jgi:hypothetical protein
MEWSSASCARQATSRGSCSFDESMSHEDHSWIDDLADERAADPQGLSIFVAEAGGRTVCDVRFLEQS